MRRSLPFPRITKKDVPFEWAKDAKIVLQSQNVSSPSTNGVCLKDDLSFMLLLKEIALFASSKRNEENISLLVDSNLNQF